MMVTQMTLGILGRWFWTLILPLLLLVSETLSHVQCVSDNHDYPSGSYAGYPHSDNESI